MHSQPPFQANIVTLGHPVLAQVATAITDPGDPQLQRLIDRLIQTCIAANGVGIAAPQLGYSWRLLVVASRPNQRYPDAPTMAPTVLINPRLVAHSEEQVKGWEGCLSVPDRRGYVPRFRQVEVSYLDRQGRPRQVVWQDFVARILQHEYDHLEGKVFLDRLENPTDVLSEAAYQTQIIGQG